MIRTLKKFLFKLILLIILLIIVCGTIGFVCKKKPQDFLHPKTNLLFVINNFNSSFTKKLNNLLKTVNPELKEVKNPKFVNIKNIYTFFDENTEISLITKEIPNFISVIDSGYIGYIAGICNIKKYFYKEDGLYKNRPEISNKIIETLKELKIDTPTNLQKIQTIYILPHKGVFLLSNSIDLINKYKNIKKFDMPYLNSAIETNKNNDIICIANSNYKFSGVECQTFAIKLDNNFLHFNTKGILNKEDYDFLKNQSTSKNLQNYLHENELYISMNDFSQAYNSNCLAPVKAGAKFLEMFMKISVEEQVKNIDGEIIFNVEDYSVLYKSKDKEISNKLIEKVEKNIGSDIVKALDNNLIKLVMDNKKTAEVEKTLTPVGSSQIKSNYFLYGIVNSNILNINKFIYRKNINLPENLKIEVIGYDNIISGNTKITYDELNEIIKSLEK